MGVKHIGRRRLSDGKSVLLWPDGQITFNLGYEIRGVGAAREKWAQEADVRAGRAFLDHASLFNSKEAPAAIKAIRKAFRDPYHGRPGFKGGEKSTFYRQAMLEAVGRGTRKKPSASLSVEEQRRRLNAKLKGVT